MEWLRKVYTEGLLDPASLSMAEIDQVKSMQAGAHTFTIAPQYNMAELNKPASGEFAGKFKIALMPGPSHATVGYVRFYAMTQKVVDAGPDYIAAACKFMDYFGGKTDGEYVVVKRWAVENGLGFAQLPLFDDKDVIASIRQMGRCAHDQRTSYACPLKRRHDPLVRQLGCLRPRGNPQGNSRPGISRWMRSIIWLRSGRN